MPSVSAGEGTQDGTKSENTSETVLAVGPGTTETIEESGTLTSPTRLTARSTAQSTATRFQRFSTARMTPTRDRETSQTESMEEDVRKLTSGSKGFETTGKTTEPKPTDMLFEKSKVPEIPTRSETENTSCRDHAGRSGSNLRLSTLCNGYLGHLQDAGRRCSCRRGNACAQGEVREGPEAKARPRRWQQTADGKWRANRLAVHNVNGELDQMWAQDDQRVDGDRQEGSQSGLEACGPGGQEGRQVPREAVPGRSRHYESSGTPRQSVQGELQVREVRSEDALHSEARGVGPSTARTDRSGRR